MARSFLCLTGLNKCLVYICLYEVHRNCTIGCVCVCAHVHACMSVCVSVVYGNSLFPEINSIILCFGTIHTEVWDNVGAIRITPILANIPYIKHY